MHACSVTTHSLLVGIHPPGTVLGQGHVSIRLGAAEQFWGVLLQFPPPPAVYVSSGAPAQPVLRSLQPGGAQRTPSVLLCLPWRLVELSSGHVYGSFRQLLCKVLGKFLSRHLYSLELPGWY